MALRYSVVHRHKLKTDMLSKGKEIERFRGEAEAIRKNLIEARRKTRSVELLRERRLAQWRKEYTIEEQEHLDDVSQKSHIRTRQAAGRRAAG